MDLSQLRCFVALAENENLTQVAHLLHVSPSSLSRTITKLESELGVQVFDREPQDRPEQRRQALFGVRAAKYDFWLSGHAPQTPTDRLECYKLRSDSLCLAVSSDNLLAKRESLPS